MGTSKMFFYCTVHWSGALHAFTFYIIGWLRYGTIKGRSSILLTCLVFCFLSFKDHSFFLFYRGSFFLQQMRYIPNYKERWVTKYISSFILVSVSKSLISSLWLIFNMHQVITH